MHIIKAHNLACPIDGTPLIDSEKKLTCTHGHVFDVARQGYVNLLPVQHKRSKQPGDSKEMIAARTRFLTAGFYEPIASRLADIIGTQLVKRTENCLMDAGCGEGYYFDKVFNDLNDCTDDSDVSFVGLDISKYAIVAAAKRNKQITWLVGTNRQPPLEPDSVDIIVSVFGFHCFDGFNKVLKTGGKVILVEPGPEHLKELRAILYSKVKKTPPPDISYAEKTGFFLADHQHLQFRTDSIDHDQINNLLVMTPHLYRATQAGREAAASLQELDLTVDIVFRVLVKKQCNDSTQ